MKAKRQLYYKVTVKRGRQQVSSAVREPAKVVYRTRRWAKPEAGRGPLCVFDTLDAALRSMSPWSHDSDIRQYSFWLCKIDPSKERSVWTNPAHAWHFNTLPYGTVLADRVKLVKRVLSGFRLQNAVQHGIGET